jgi:hypothetical protein
VVVGVVAVAVVVAAVLSCDVSMLSDSLVGERSVLVELGL